MLTEVLSNWRTIVPHVRGRLLPPRAPKATDWRTSLEDPEVGTLQLSGQLRLVPDANEIVVLVHGLGGSAESLEVRRGAAQLAACGVSTLSLSLRGSDRLGADFYNVGQTADIRAAIKSPAVSVHSQVYVIGYSMGGYAALHTAQLRGIPKLKAVASVCTPLDIKATQLHIDRARTALYRKRILRGLIEIYSQVAKQREVPTPVSIVSKVNTFYDWDRLTIAPRYGFDNADHFYCANSLAKKQNNLGVPALLVAAESDPVISPACIRPFLCSAPARADSHALQVRWVRRAGHLGFSNSLDLSFGPTLGLEAQLLHWLRRYGEPGTSARH